MLEYISGILPRVRNFSLWDLACFFESFRPGGDAESLQHYEKVLQEPKI